jgi:hypothetical protein
MTMDELRSRLKAKGIVVGYGGLWRFCAPQDHMEKTAHASEPVRPDIPRQRRAWFDAQPDLDVGSWSLLMKLGPQPIWQGSGRAPRGKRLRAGIPHGHRKTTIFVAGLRLSGLVALLHRLGMEHRKPQAIPRELVRYIRRTAVRPTGCWAPKGVSVAVEQ